MECILSIMLENVVSKENTVEVLTYQDKLYDSNQEDCGPD